MPKSKEFISSSDSDSNSDSEPKPKKKKTKKESPVKEKAAKKEKSSDSKGPAEEHSFQLSKMRFVTVSEFHGKVLVGIREYYEAGGDLKPTKKGISLSQDQWNKLKDQMDDIDKAIASF